MEKRALMAVVMSVLVLVAYQYLYIKPKLKSLPQNVAKQAPEVQPSPGGSPPVNGPGDALKGQAAPSVPAASQSATQAAETAGVNVEEKSIKVETPFYSAVLSSKGATIKSFTLKMYKEKDGREIALLKQGSGLNALAIGNGTDFNLSKFNFTTSATDLSLSKGQESTVVFELNQGATSVKRTYTFSGDGYSFALKDEVAGLSGYYLALGNDFNKESVSSYGEHLGPVVLNDMDRVEFKADKKLDSLKTLSGDIKWIANENKYFCEAVVPTNRTGGAVTGQSLPQGKEAIVWKEGNSAIAAYKSGSAVNEFLIFVGPKKYELLKSLNVNLEHIVDFGFFSIISRPLFWILVYIDRYVGNYGWSIIILTLVVRIPFIPLITKGQSSMKKLQKIQPLMNAIREQYKKDPQRMQKEIMELYKKHKVNPMGGCLPILIQIPVFFALYKVLLVAIELRGASWTLWIKDLSAKDPYYILPIIMGITMLVQQKMTPSTMDPTQAKIMMFMPIIFTFMFLNFPSGLVLYWLVSNLLSISQQFYVNKRPATV